MIWYLLLSRMSSLTWDFCFSVSSHYKVLANRCFSAINLHKTLQMFNCYDLQHRRKTHCHSHSLTPCLPVKWGLRSQFSGQGTGCVYLVSHLLNNVDWWVYNNWATAGLSVVMALTTMLPWAATDGEMWNTSRTVTLLTGPTALMSTFVETLH